MKADPLEAKIIITLTKSGDKTKAIATLDFESFKVKGFRIRTNENGDLWVNPPVIPRFGKRAFIIFYMEDKEHWHKLQKKIIEAFKNEEIPVVEEEHS